MDGHAARRGEYQPTGTALHRVVVVCVAVCAQLEQLQRDAASLCRSKPRPSNGSIRLEGPAAKALPQAQCGWVLVGVAGAGLRRWHWHERAGRRSTCRKDGVNYSSLPKLIAHIGRGNQFVKEKVTTTAQRSSWRQALFQVAARGQGAAAGNGTSARWRLQGPKQARRGGRRPLLQCVGSTWCRLVPIFSCRRGSSAPRRRRRRVPLRSAPCALHVPPPPSGVA